VGRVGHRLVTEYVDPEGNETRVLHELIDFAGTDVLEIGCGEGRLIWRYADLTASVLGLDQVESDIEHARRDTPRHLRSKVEFRTGDAVTAEFPPGSFDVVVLGRSI
jgi:2-polyprenyl-3-methyl-5-hydroxy-6-metoxy-1,4-benzoquinol methylase